MPQFFNRADSRRGVHSLRCIDEQIEKKRGPELEMVFQRKLRVKVLPDGVARPAGNAQGHDVREEQAARGGQGVGGETGQNWFLDG
jgi:hypothetical protein